MFDKNTDPDQNARDEEYKAFIEQADKETLYWGLYRVLEALYCARAEDPLCQKTPLMRGGLYNVTHMAADHWGSQIPGMPVASEIRAETIADNVYHELTFLAERMGLRVTGDEFIFKGDDLI